MTQLNAARERTDAKLQYAAVHLDELQQRRRLARADGSPWERAHQESFLFHLLGTRDALLQEINIFHSCGLPMKQVAIGSISQRLVRSGVVSKALRTLMRMEGLRSSWLSVAKRLRHRSTHQKGIPHQFVMDSKRDDPVYLRDPGTGELIEVDFIELFAQWHEKATKLVENLRSKMPGAENG